jgi:zinc transporter
MRRESSLEPDAAEAMLAEETRPRSISFKDGMLVILRGVNLNPGSDPEDMVALRVWIEKNRVISVRARRLMAVQDLRDTLDAGRGPKDCGELLVGIANRLVDRMGPVVDDMGDVVDGLENELLISESRDIRMKLRELRREAIGLRRHLAPQRDALSRLQQDEQPWLEAPHRRRLRETADRVLRIVEELDELRERAAIIQDELMNRLSEQMNRTMYVLTVVASVLLPLSFLTGLLGINVGGIPWAENNLGFLIVVIVLVVVGMLQLLIFRRLKWL